MSSRSDAVQPIQAGTSTSQLAFCRSVIALADCSAGCQGLLAKHSVRFSSNAALQLKRFLLPYIWQLILVFIAAAPGSVTSCLCGVSMEIVDQKCYPCRDSHGTLMGAQFFLSIRAQGWSALSYWYSVDTHPACAGEANSSTCTNCNSASVAQAHVNTLFVLLRKLQEASTWTSAIWQYLG